MNPPSSPASGPRLTLRRADGFPALRRFTRLYRIDRLRPTRKRRFDALQAAIERAGDRFVKVNISRRTVDQNGRGWHRSAGQAEDRAFLDRP